MAHLHGSGSPSGGWSAAAGRLRWAILLNAGFITVEVAVGLGIGSLALMSDAWHNATDVLALAIAWAAVRLVRRPADSGRTFGYHRAGILAALANGVLLLGVTLGLLLDAAHRLRHPPGSPPAGLIILLVAAIGIVVNAGAAYALHGAGRDLHLRSAFLHLMADALVSAGVVAAGALILITGWTWPDAAASVLINLVVLAGAWKILSESLNVLMEGAPRGMDLGAVAEAIGRLPGVREVHHLHAWCLSADFTALSCHVVAADQPISEGGLLVAHIRQLLEERFNIRHVTIQLESSMAPAEELLGICPWEHLTR